MNSIITIFILVLVIFQYLSERKLENYEKIHKKIGKKLKSKINNIKKELLIININEGDNYDSVMIKIENNKQPNHKYVVIKKEEFALSDKVLNLLISNYIYMQKLPCGFNINLMYKSENNKKSKLKEIFNNFYVISLNYLDIFNKKDLLSYGVTISKLDDNIYNNKNKVKIISYIPNDIMVVKLDTTKTKLMLKDYYNKKISKVNIFTIFKVLLFIIYGTIITGNVIYSAFNVIEDPFGFITALLIYFCYIYIIKYIYRPMGRYKVLAKYMFPVYIVGYIFIIIGVSVKKVIDRVTRT